ncbi:MAG TPA: M43 family zinc metalloprotease [Aldersonia sp.]
MTSTETTGRLCGAMEIHRRLLTESESYRIARAQLETATMGFSALEVDETVVARVPVVVHVVHATDQQNISDAQVHSQIAVLNEDFRATNSDTDTVPAAFADLVHDGRVEFVLADADPDGKRTTGITRTRTRVRTFGTDDGVKDPARGGVAPWPADRYLNLWVAQLSGGLLGYAQFPGGPAETDGVVVTYTAFGTTGTATAPFHLGRTATHEIGHYFNLFHIWGDDGTGCGGTDEVDDTPNQAGPNTGKPTWPHVTCRNGPHGDLFMDYMDYVDDDMMVMFTPGQVTRMWACLQLERKALWTAAA